jgi:hypothetical protein
MAIPKSHSRENRATAANPLGAEPLYSLSVPAAALQFERGVFWRQGEAEA